MSKLRLTTKEVGITFEKFLSLTFLLLNKKTENKFKMKDYPNSGFEVKAERQSSTLKRYWSKEKGAYLWKVYTPTFIQYSLSYKRFEGGEVQFSIEEKNKNKLKFHLTSKDKRLSSEIYFNLSDKEIKELLISEWQK